MKPSEVAILGVFFASLVALVIISGELDQVSYLRWLGGR